MGTMFLVLPALWLTAFGWAGAKSWVRELGNMTSNDFTPAHSAGGERRTVSRTKLRLLKKLTNNIFEASCKI